jgi:hypothetical protein
MLKRDRIEAVLAYLGVAADHKTRRTGWVVSTCPFAPWKHEGGVDRSPSFGVSVDEGTHLNNRQVYHCFSCQATGLLDDLPFNLREHYREDSKGRPRPNFGEALQIIVADEDDELDLDNIPDYDEPQVDPDEVIVWPEWFLESFKSVFAFEQAMNYLTKRGVPSGVIERLDLRYDTSRERVAFPIRDFGGKLVGLHGRHIGDHPLRYYAYGFEGRRNRMPWLGEHWVDFEVPVLLVESVFDLASVLRVYGNAMCGLSAGLGDSKLERIRGAISYVTLYDYGTGGDRAREAISRVLGADAHVAHCVPTEAQGDPGEMCVVELQEHLGGKLRLD